MNSVIKLTNSNVRSWLIITLFLIISLFTNNCYSQKINNARWWDEHLNNTVKSLPLPYFLYNFDSRIFYIIANDKDSLFVCLKIPDVYQQRMILRGGITVWIDLKDKKHRKLGIRFPVADRPPKHVKEEEEPYMEIDDRKNQLIEHLNGIELIGFSADEDRYLIPCNNPEEIHAFIDFDMNGYLFYKLVVPFNKLPVSNWNAEKLFSIGIGTSGQKKEGHESEGMHPGGRGGRTGGMEGGYGGRNGDYREMGGGPPPGGDYDDPDHSRNMQQSFAPINFWIKKIKLANR